MSGSGRLALAVGLMVALGPTAQAGVLYGITWDDKLITIDQNTGAGSLVGPLDSSMAAFGLADRAGRLYTFDQLADRIRELDPATGATINTIDIGLSLMGEGSLAFRSDGIGYIISALGALRRFDITVPSSTFVNAPIALMDGMDFDNNDVLYGLTEGEFGLYVVDQNIGSMTWVGDVADGPSDVAGMSFRPDGVLFAAIDDYGPGGHNLYSIDPATAHAIAVGPIGYRVSGLSFLEPPIPEPGTIALLAIGVTCLRGRRRRRQRWG